MQFATSIPACGRRIKCAGRPALFLLLLAALVVGRPAAAPASDLLTRLQAVPALSGYEDSLRALVLAQLPGWAHPDVDALGNVVVELGGEGPLRLLTAPLDEPGYVVSQVDTLGYLRLSRLAGAGRLFDQFHVGQRFVVLTTRGALPAVSAAPSIHLRRVAPYQVEPMTVDDLWLDAGFHSGIEAGRAGVELLDPVSLVERYTPLAGSRAAGPALEGRAEVAALLRALGQGRPHPRGHWVVAFTAQAQTGGRGLRRLLERFRPAEAYLLGGFPGAQLGGGPAVLADSLHGLAPELARRLVRLAGKSGQREDRAFAPDEAGLDPLARVPAAILGLPVRYARTPSEIVDTHDVDALAALLRRLWEGA